MGGVDLYLRARARSKVVALVVKDHGRGFSAEERARWLSSRWPDPWDRQPFPCFGLNLVVCRDIVEGPWQ